ncbi:hypothetical protein EV12_0688 [Prochlorococcus sp. MIT 0701]|nr:hypothetical protein EV12_0688 [Prochlorococcus sp. MIT 0701]
MAFGQGTNTSLRSIGELAARGRIKMLRCRLSAMGLTQVASSPGPLETSTTASEASGMTAGGSEVKL